MSNQECKIRPEIVNVNSKEPVFFPSSIKTSKCSGSCNNINELFPKLCVSDVFKNLNAKVFNLMSRTNEARHIEWHEACSCKCRLDASACNSKQRWNEDKCRCECKELILKVYGIKDLFGIQVIANVNVVNCMILVSILTMKIVSVEKIS